MRLPAVLCSAAAIAISAPAIAEPRSYDVPPQATDPEIRTFLQPHRVFLDEAAPSRRQLLVYLPGTGATTADQDEFGRTAAGLGYHVVYVMYPNDVAAASCQDDEDETTFEKFRREIIAGGDLDPRVAVDRADGIESRLRHLVTWLAAHRGAEGWGQYLDGADVSWARIVLAGHSQGGGHAQLMAMDHAVARVVVFGSPKDYNRRHGRPARWYGTGATPASRMFALVHRQDKQACSYEQQLENLRASGLTSTADIDAIAPPYNDAHVLTTNQPGREVNSALAHLGLVFDFMLPRGNDGRMPYRPAWIYMLTTIVK